MRVEASSTTSTRDNYGVLIGAMSYVLWGVLAIYWKLLKAVPAYEILAHRVLWSFIFVTAVVLAQGNWAKVKNVLKQKKLMTYIFFASICVSINWFLYIWAVTSGHILDSSLGYYINPLMSIFIGMLVLKEKLNKIQYVALITALVGVIAMVVLYGSIPWVSLGLAVSFALYGLFKKLASVEPIVSLTLETLIVAPVALVFLIIRQVQGYGAFGSSSSVTFLLAFAGIVTAVPLLLFAEGTRKVKLSTMGFLQYLTPTISLFIGVFVYKESFVAADLFKFGLIWISLAIYSYSLLKKQRPKNI
jgi:chloramphenicol-sensitive protein RarD